MRTATIKRDTRETQIELTLNLDGTGKASIASGCGGYINRSGCKRQKRNQSCYSKQEELHGKYASVELGSVRFVRIEPVEGVVVGVAVGNRSRNKFAVTVGKES